MEQGSVSFQNLFKIYGKHVIVYHSTVISQLSSHKIMKNCGFQLFSNLLVFTANQT